MALAQLTPARTWPESFFEAKWHLTPGGVPIWVRCRLTARQPATGCSGRSGRTTIPFGRS